MRGQIDFWTLSASSVLVPEAPLISDPAAIYLSCHFLGLIVTKHENDMFWILGGRHVHVCACVCVREKEREESHYLCGYSSFSSQHLYHYPLGSPDFSSLKKEQERFYNSLSKDSSFTFEKRVEFSACVCLRLMLGVMSLFLSALEGGLVGADSQNWWVPYSAIGRQTVWGV